LIELHPLPHEPGADQGTIAYPSSNAGTHRYSIPTSAGGISLAYSAR
jgi:hypothetical protein